MREIPIPTSATLPGLAMDAGAMIVPTGEPDDFLTRVQAAEAVNEIGIPLSPHTLATWATRPPKDGSGPPMVKFGSRVLYERGPLMEWAKSRLSAPRRSTSETIRHSA